MMDSGGEAQVYACGLNTASQLDSATPEPITSLQRVQKLACGRTHCLALSNRGELLSWGSGMGWKLGHRDTHDAVSAQLIQHCESNRTCCIISKKTINRSDDDHSTTLPKIMDVACGEHHSVCVDVNGLVYTWGLGREGQLGTPSTNHHLSIPREIDSSYFNYEKVIKVAANSCFSMAITEHGRLYSWGWGGMFRLGHGNETQCLIPTLVEDLVKNNIIVKDVRCGWRHTVCITSLGHVMSWGDNSRGQAGTSEGHVRKLPQFIDKFIKRPAMQIACGDFFTLVLTKQNVLYGFGNATSGELANEQSFTIGFESVPRVLESVMLQTKLVSHISAGSEHACAVSVDGSVWCWGSCEHGELGNYSLAGEEAVYIPSRISLPGEFSKTFCGQTFSMFVRASPPSIEYSEQQITKDFQSLMNTESNADICLRVSDGSLMAHSVVLCARSAVLASLINDLLPEEDSMRELDLTSFDISYFELRSIIEYMYTGALYFHKFSKGCNITATSVAKRVKYCGDCFGLNSLVDLCERFKIADSYCNYKLVDVESMQSDMVSIINDENTADFSIHVHLKQPNQDEVVVTYRVHECILVSRSEYFRNLIHANMIEAHEREVHFYDVECPNHFLQLLKFLYSDDEDLIISYLNSDDFDEANKRETRVFEMLALADSFMVSRLKQVCEMFIGQNYGEPNEQLRSFAIQFQATQLMEHCEFYLRRMLASSDQLAELDAPIKLPAKERTDLSEAPSDALDEENETMFNVKGFSRRRRRILSKRWKSWIGNEQRFRDKLRILQRRQTWNTISYAVWRLVKKIILTIFLILFYVPFFVCVFMYGLFTRFIFAPGAFDFDAPPAASPTVPSAAVNRRGRQEEQQVIIHDDEIIEH